MVRKQVTITDLKRRTADLINDLANGPIRVTENGRQVAVIVDVETYTQLLHAVAEIEAT